MRVSALVMAGACGITLGACSSSGATGAASSAAATSTTLAGATTSRVATTTATTAPAPTTTRPPVQAPKDVCSMLAAADVATATAATDAGKSHSSQSPNQTISTCTWGAMGTDGLTVTIKHENVARLATLAKASYVKSSTAVTIAGLGELAAREEHFVVFFKGADEVTVLATKGDPDALVALAKKIEPKL
jgi:hypothetical protein